MKKILGLISIIALIFIIAMLPGKSKRIIFFGDSITEAGVNPGGYITLLDSIIKTTAGEGQYELKGAGIGGNKIYDLFLRMDEDVIAKNPDIVVIYVGVNDVWHKKMFGTGTDADKFEKFYNAVIKRIKDRNITVVVCTPAVIGEKTNNGNEMDKDLNLFSNIIRNIAAAQKLPLVDLRKSFTEYNAAHNKNNDEKGILTTDQVHLNSKGNKLVAEEIWRVLKPLK